MKLPAVAALTRPVSRIRSSRVALLVAACGVLSVVVPARADNAGDWYDNRDEGHTRLDLSRHPGLQAMSSGVGGQYDVIADRVVVGNASLAITSGPQWSSMGRLLLLTQLGARSIYEQYRAGNFYWYPEHRDHDAEDQFHAMSPALGVSQGSSGSEMDEVAKWLRALAALQPATKARLRETGLLMPTLVALFRRSRVASDEEYLSALAHPSAFDNAPNGPDFAALAAALSSEDLPPLALIQVDAETYDAEEESSTSTYFRFPGRTERLFTTPIAIARVHRSFRDVHSIRISAESSFDPDGAPLSYHWRVLRGDPDEVDLRILDGGRSAQIDIRHHDRAPTSDDRTSRLVVVALFVNDGTQYSAPAFFTSYTLGNETRVRDVDGGFAAFRYSDGYVHPSISHRKTWAEDAIVRDVDGSLRGWIRTDDGERFELLHDGRVVSEGDLESGVLGARQVRYFLSSPALELHWESTGETAPVVALRAELLRSDCDTAEISWSVRSPSALRGAELWLEYDPTVLSPETLEAGGAVAGWRDGAGPEIWRVDLAARVDQRHAVQLVFDAAASGRGEDSLAAGSTHEIARLSFRRRASGGREGTVAWARSRSSARARSGAALPLDTRGVRWDFGAGCRPGFVRGECNGDGRFDLSDPVGLLVHLFDAESPFPPVCADACDADDSGVLDVSDAVRTLAVLFRGGEPLPPPGVECGEDLTPDHLSCEEPRCR